MKPRGNPHCRACGGNGVKPTTNGFVPCHCVRGTAQTRKMMHKANAAGAPVPAGDAVRKAWEGKSDASHRA